MNTPQPTPQPPTPLSGPLLTLQEIYTKGLLHIRKQGRPSIGPDEKCVYRSTDGCACIAGCFIPNPLYDPLFDKDAIGVPNPGRDTHIKSVIQLTAAFFAGGVNLSNLLVYRLMRDMQAAHDIASIYEGRVADNDIFMEHFEREMRNVARRHDVSYTMPGVTA